MGYLLILWIVGGKLVFDNRNLLKGVNSIEVKVVNSTENQRITYLVEEGIIEKLSRINKYKKNGDFLFKCIITEFVGYEERIEKVGEGVHYYEREKEKDDEKITTGSEDVDYEFKKITKNPSIGLKFSLKRKEDGKLVYHGRSFVGDHIRLPGTHFTKYRSIFNPEELSSTDFVTSLAIIEMLQPLFPPMREIKDPRLARLLSTLIPGVGSMYAGNLLGGIFHLGVESLLIGGAIYCFMKIDTAPTKKKDDEFGTKTDYTVFGITCGVCGLIYHIFQLLKAEDDARVVNYKRWIKEVE